MKYIFLDRYVLSTQNANAYWKILHKFKILNCYILAVLYTY